MADAKDLPDQQSADALFAAVYARLKAMASRQLAGQRRNATLDTTELVHELYLRMGQRHALQFEQPAQFFTYAARAMRHLLINRARDRLRLRAGGQWNRVTLDDHDLQLAFESAEQALALDAALTALEEADARAARASVCSRSSSAASSASACSAVSSASFSWWSSSVIRCHCPPAHRRRRSRARLISRWRMARAA